MTATAEQATSPVDPTRLSDSQLARLAASCVAELKRRKAVYEGVRRAAAYRVLDEGGDDPRWTPEMWDGARLCAGPRRGLKGFIVGRCTDGCENVDGLPRWRLSSIGGGHVQVTCIPRTHLRPMPTVRRPGGPGRAHCDRPCRCCMRPPIVKEV
jgi:hypothetical protein